MTFAELGRLADAGKLKREAANQVEFEGLVSLGEAKFRDARNLDLSLPGRFDLVYGASHAFSLAALRWCGYRTEFRYVVFQSLEHTLGLPRDVWRVLDKAHGDRNIAEYGGMFIVTERLYRDLVAATTIVEERVFRLGSVG